MEDDRLKRKSFLTKLIDDPAIPVGMTAFFAVVIYGIRNYDKKYNATAYFGQVRVVAQGLVVGALALTVAYDVGKSIYKSMNSSTDSSPSSSSLTPKK